MGSSTTDTSREREETASPYGLSGVRGGLATALVLAAALAATLPTTGDFG